MSVATDVYGDRFFAKFEPQSFERVPRSAAAAAVEERRTDRVRSRRGRGRSLVRERRVVRRRLTLDTSASTRRKYLVDESRRRRSGRHQPAGIPGAGLSGCPAAANRQLRDAPLARVVAEAAAVDRRVELAPTPVSQRRRFIDG